MENKVLSDKKIDVLPKAKRDNNGLRKLPIVDMAVMLLMERMKYKRLEKEYCYEKRIYKWNIN